jgi:predicted methyltransferase
MLGIVQAAAADPLAEAVNNPARSDADRVRDQRSKPAEMMAFMGAAPGMTVLDLFSGGGYYSELLAYVVGEDGQVYAHTNKAYEGWVGTQYDARFADDRVPNIVRHHAETDDLGLKDDSFNLAIMVMSYHDVYYTDTGWPGIDAKDFLSQIYDAIKPGGTLVVIDHVADAGTGSASAQDLHRIDPDFARQDFERIGFSFEGASEVLRKSADDHNLSSFDPSIRGNTDKFAFRFSKPQD